MTTPTPGDLSARHVEVLRHLLDCHGNHTVIDDDDASALTEAIAALSAPPAAGGGCGDHDHADYIPGCPKCALTLPEKHTTPQPSAAEGGCSGYCCPGCGRCYQCHKQALECATTTPDAAVGAQGDGYPNTSDVPDSELREQLSACRDDWQRLCDAVEPGQHFDPDDLIRRLAAPAAGKGVDDVLADMRRTTPGDDEHIEALLADYADKIEAALTRQPVVEDAERFAWWFMRGDDTSDEIVELMLRQLNRDPPSLNDWRKAIDNAMAAPAATPTDGGEGK